MVEFSTIARYRGDATVADMALVSRVLVSLGEANLARSTSPEPSN
jgi:hypothetical protein